MKKAQAMQILCALFETETVGVADGEMAERILNQGFIRACKVADPELPSAAYTQPWIARANQGGTAHISQGKWARFFRELADGIDGMEEPRA